MDKELSKKLNDCGIKKSLIEVQLKMPKNSLVGMINGTRPTPKKWEEKLWEFVKYTEVVYEKKSDCSADINSIPVLEEKTLSDTFTRESVIENAFNKPLKLLKWVTEIQEYCGTIGIAPEELIEEHKHLSANKTVKVKSKAVEEIVKKGNDYNPNDNWRFKSKLGKKD